MIVSRVIGGLGNQMFQYAVGRALSLERSQPLSLDVSGFVGYGLHQGYELKKVFACAVEAASKADIRKVLGWQSLPAVQRIVSRPLFARIRSAEYVVEPHFHYWHGIKFVSDNVYLSGYWQSEKYFKSQADVIRADFTFQGQLNARNAEISEQIRRTNAVSLHVRRGDYVTNEKTAATHGVCSLDYYRAAIEYIESHIKKPTFFIFSDDPEWVKMNFRIDCPYVHVDHNQGSESYNDMYLMSLCRHHIIANSSFSWWGAWLNPVSDKIVIAPRRWFANENDVSDLFPEGWVTL